MPTTRQQLGTWAEGVAEDFLRRKGYDIIDRHVTSRYGEIDILARDQETIVAVEVKTRRSDAYGTAEESVTPKKLTRIRTALEELGMKKNWHDVALRIDLVAISGTRQRYDISHLEDIST